RVATRPELRRREVCGRAGHHVAGTALLGAGFRRAGAYLACVSETTPRTDRGDLKSTSYEFFMLAMAILSIANLPLLVLYPYESQSWQLVVFVEAALTLVFVIAFVYRLKTAPSKVGYFIGQKGFLDLLSCLPALRIFRLFRIVRAVRIVRQLGGPRVFRELRQELASGALYF